MNTAMLQIPCVKGDLKTAPAFMVAKTGTLDRSPVFLGSNTQKEMHSHWHACSWNLRICCFLVVVVFLQHCKLTIFRFWLVGQTFFTILWVFSHREFRNPLIMIMKLTEERRGGSKSIWLALWQWWWDASPYHLSTSLTYDTRITLQLAYTAAKL